MRKSRRRKLYAGLGWGAGVALVGLLFFQPRWLLQSFVAFKPGAAFFAETEQPLIALTLDDGPYPETTEEILDVLAEYDAQATFFVIGDRIPAHTTALQRIAAEGHELGNHLRRDEASIRLSTAEFETALIETEEAIAQALDVSGSSKLQWMRPGMGWYSAEMIAIAQRHGYRTALGDIFPYDTHIASTGFAAQQILWNAQPGSIIVLHDGTAARGQRTAATLRQVLPELKQKGYRVVSLSQLFAAEP